MTSTRMNKQACRLPDAPLIGEIYPNAGSWYRVRNYRIEDDSAWVENIVSGWVCMAHHPALYDIGGCGVELQWDYSTDGHFE